MPPGEACPRKKARSDDCVRGQRQPPSLHVALHAEVGEIEIDQEDNDHHLGEIQDALPIHSPGFSFGIEEQTHHQRRHPHVVEHVHAPEPLSRKIQDAAVVRSQNLSH